ncbi:hypothetical protein NS506_04334 [Nocardia seriolae]|uniref:Uncharacterized protein n=1 Tax=Nocardia seriolae TaxID=37332 RepID=A0ABC8AX60_9NOCA|nr:hypothetical protein [Nocardia seriolae]APA98382.1 hypothetical protein NS506_04334 [Nocardia seriolae]
MTIRHAPLFILAVPLLLAGVALSGAPAIALLVTLLLTAVPILLLLLLPDDLPAPMRLGHRFRSRP